MSIVQMSSRHKKQINIKNIDQEEDVPYIDPAFDAAVEREMLNVEREMEFKQKLKNAEDEIFADADRIVIQKGDNLTESKVILVDKDGRYTRSKVISKNEMIDLFRNVTRKYLTNDTELRSIKNRVIKEFYNNKE